MKKISIGMAMYLAMQNLDVGLFGKKIGKAWDVVHTSHVPSLPKKPRYNKKGEIQPVARNLMDFSSEEYENLKKLSGLAKKYYVRMLQTKYDFPRVADFSLNQFVERFGVV